jgi:SSS family solute:Na+ symporter
MPQYADGFKHFGNNYVVPALFLQMFPGWFVGVAFAAIAIGALVPAAIMSIACANLFTRNIYREFCVPNCSPAHEAQAAKIVSLFVKLGALAFVLEAPTQYAIELQLLGGVWIIQTLPCVMFGLYTRWLNGRALLIGWFCGMGAGTWMAAQSGFKASVYVLHVGSFALPCYAALSSLVFNIVVSVVLSFVFNAALAPRPDMTIAEDYA